MKAVGLIGLGLVGTALAEKYIASGFHVIGYDIIDAKIEHLERIGGKGAASPAAVANQVNSILLSLMTSDIVQDVIEGENGIVYVDAPVAGSSKQIRNGEGVFMIGGSPEAFQMAKELLGVVSKQVIHVGGSGAGSRAKLVVNLVLGLNRLVLAEGLVFAEKVGLDPAKALELFAVTPAYSRAIDAKGAKMVRGDFSPEARLSQHLKDVHQILAMARHVGQQLPLSEIHHELLERAVAAGDGDLDNSAVIKNMRQRVDDS